MTFRSGGVGMGWMAVVVLLAGCGGADDANTNAQDSTLVGAPITEVKITLAEWAVEPWNTSVPTGQIRFVITNHGKVPHEFEVEGNGVEYSSEEIEPTRTVTMTVGLRPGTYEIYCPRKDDHGNHREMGMRNQIRVNPVGEAN